MKQLLYSLLLIWILCPFLKAQTRTSDWQTSIPYTYVYKLSEEQSKDFIFSSVGKERVINGLMRDEQALHTSFIDKWENQPESGHFILVNIEGSQMKFNYLALTPYKVNASSTNGLLNIQVIDNNGKSREDASVHLYLYSRSSHREKLIYDAQTQTYTRSKRKKKRGYRQTYPLSSFYLEVELDSAEICFRAEKDAEKAKTYNTYPFQLTASQKWAGDIPYINLWKKRANLANMPFYKLLYPSDEQWFIHTEEAPDSITQFAPFVSFNGKLEEVKVIECEGSLIWFSWIDNIRNYSFPITPGRKHTIKLRTAENNIVIETDTCFFEPGKKTIFSINNNSNFHFNKNISVQKAAKHQEAEYKWRILYEGNTLDNDEARHYRKHIARVPVQPNAPYTFLRQDEKQIPVKINNQETTLTYQKVGPVTPGITMYNDSIEYDHEGGFRHEFKGGLVYKYEDKELVPRSFFRTFLQYPFKQIHDFHSIDN